MKPNIILRDKIFKIINLHYFFNFKLIIFFTRPKLILKFFYLTLRNKIGIIN